MLNGLSVLPFEILSEESYNQAIKDHFRIKWKCKASSCLFVWVFLNMRLEGPFLIILNGAER